MKFSRNPSTGAVEAYTDEGIYVGTIYSVNEEETKDFANDGGPGSGNFGHKGRPGLVGGSGPGGGKQYRGGRADIGYFSSKKDWLNGLTGEKQKRASDLVKNAEWHLKSKLDRKEKIGSLWKRGLLTKDEHDESLKEAGLDKIDENTSPEGFIMKLGDADLKKDLMGMVGEARSWSDRGMRLQKENLSEDEEKALTTLAWGIHNGGNELTQEEFLNNDLDRVFDKLSPEQKEFYLDMKAKACGLQNSGKEISDYSDELQVSVGAKEETKNPEDFFSWMDSGDIALGIKLNGAPNNLCYAAGVPTAKENHPKTNKERMDMWKTALNEVANNPRISQTRMESAARIMYYSTLADIDGWSKAVASAANGGKIPGLTREESKEFVELIKDGNPWTGNFDITNKDNVINAEHNAIDNLYGDDIRRYILLKNKAVSGIAPASKEEYAEMEKQRKAKEAEAGKRFAANIENFNKEVINQDDSKGIETLLTNSGIFKKGESVHLSFVSTGNARDIAYSYGKVMQRFPFLYGRIGAVTSAKLESSTFANCARNYGGAVQVSTKYFSGDSYLAREYDDCVRTGFHPKGTYSDSIITHELGHALGGYLTSMGVAGSRSSSSGTDSFEGILRKRVFKKMKMKLTKTAIEQELSKYAAKNTLEWFAEAFAEAIHSPNPRPMAKTMMEELTSILREEGLIDA